MTTAERFRRRRCFALQLAIFFGVLLPIFTRTWLSLGVAIVGIALAAVSWWRNCRGLVTNAERSGTH